MSKRSELEYKLKKTKYDLETKQMEYKGYKVRYHDLKTQNIYWVVIFMMILLFMKLTIWSDNMFLPFAIVLTPIFYVLLGIYIILMVRNFVNCFLNSNAAVARSIAKRRHRASLSEQMEKCSVEIGMIERKVEEMEIELEEMEE